MYWRIYFLSFTLYFKVLLNMKNNEALEAVKQIKTMMEKSSRFTSFSGTSAILIGLYALSGAFIAQSIISSVRPTPHEYFVQRETFIAPQLFVLASIILLLALGTILFFSIRKTKKSGQSFLNSPAYRTLFNFFLPLITGGIFCIALFLNGYFAIIAPGMLLFYGLSLINASKYTYDNIFWLGCAELLLGLTCAFFPGKGLLFWTLGFGILHILYGVYFYIFIERKEKLS